MTSSSALPVSGWRITGQVQTQQLPPGAQNFVQGFDITFVTGDNVTSKVFVPITSYTPDKVRAAIDEQAAAIDAVHALTAPPAG